MPGVGHLLFGLGVLLPMLYLGRDRKAFHYKVALIYFMNNYIGPDGTHVIGDLVGFDLHALFGFAFYAIPLSLFYSYLSRFSMHKGKSRFSLEIIDVEIREVSWKNAYLLTIAGGISHNMIDFLFHPGFKTDILSPLGYNFTLNDMLAWGWGPSNDSQWTPMAILATLVIIFLIIGGWHFLERGFNDTFKLFLVGCGINSILMIVLGMASQGGEREWGAMFFVSFYIMLPFMFLAIGMKDTIDHPRTGKCIPRVSRKVLFNLVMIVILALFGIIFISGLLVVTTNFLVDTFSNVLGSAGTLQVMGWLFMGITAFGIIMTIGVLVRSDASRRIFIIISTILLLFGTIPYAIALLLSENEIKQQFVRKKKDSNG